MAIWEQAVERFHQAIDEAYPSGFWEKMHRLRDGDLDAVEEAIRFLEADPYFFRSGYSKQWLLRRVKRAPLSSIQAERLRQVVLDRVDRRAGREFREYARLARVLDSPELRSALESRLESPDPKIVHRTRHVLAVCDNDGAFFRSRFTW